MEEGRHAIYTSEAQYSVISTFIRHMFVFKVDVSGAYESLPHDKLTEVVDQAVSPLKSELLLIRRYAKIWANSHEGLKKAFVRQVNPRTCFGMILFFFFLFLK